MIFAIMDIVDPYKGLYNISSKNMHQALGAMRRQTVIVVSRDIADTYVSGHR